MKSEKRRNLRKMACHSVYNGLRDTEDNISQLANSQFNLQGFIFLNLWVYLALSQKIFLKFVGIWILRITDFVCFLNHQKIKLTMQNSKALTLNFVQSAMRLQEQLPHHHCFCYHCVNNTKPIPYIPAPRITSQKQRKLCNSNAYQLVLKELVNGFSGKCQVPDVYFIGKADLVYPSSSGRPKMKQEQTNIDVKKHFEEQRRKVAINANTAVINFILSFIQSEPSITFNNQKIVKEIAIMAYHDGTEQVLADTMLSKILEKRKNDPFWDGVSHILLIPPEVKHPFTKITHHFVRSNDTLPSLLPAMEKIAKDVDNIQQNQLTGKTKFMAKDTEDFLDMDFSMNPESKFIRNNSSNSKSMISERNSIKVNFNKNSITESPSQIIKNICIQVVAHLQVASFTRILQADFEFFTDGSKFFLCNIGNFVYDQLDESELTLIHDRFKPLEEISLKEIAASKRILDSKEANQLWKICSALVNECLQLRKVELKLANYKKPNEQTLLKIFMKIFPDFKPQKVFGSINWKNELDDFVAQTRKKINKIIREDEGIRILRRFGIQFRRTFH